VLDRHTLADLLRPERRLAKVLVFSPPAGRRTSALAREPR
jgi:hypothetical protein